MTVDLHQPLVERLMDFGAYYASVYQLYLAAFIGLDYPKAHNAGAGVYSNYPHGSNGCIPEV